MTTERIRPGRASVAWLAAVALIPLVLLVVIPLSLSTKALGDEVTDRVSDNATASAVALQEQMRAISGAVAAFSTRSDFSSPSAVPISDASSPVRAALRELQRSNPNIRRVSLFDATGHSIAAEPWTNEGLGGNFSYRDYFTGAISHSGPYVSDVFIAASAGKPKLVAVSQALHAPGTGDAGPVTGVLLATVDTTATFQQYVNNFKDAHDVRLDIYDQHQNIVASPGMGAEMKTSSDPKIQAARRGESWSGKHVIDGRPVVASFVEVPGTTWVVSASVPEKSAFAVIERLRNNVLLIALILGAMILAGMVLLARTIAGRERAEKSAVLSNRQRQLVLDTAGQAFIEVNRSGVVLDWNAQAERMLGWTRQEIMGKTLRETIIPAQSEDQFFDLVNRMFDDPDRAIESVEIEGLALRKGETVPFPVQSSLWVTRNGDDIHLNGLLSDITDRKKIESEREMMVKRSRHLIEELQLADKAKSDFVSTVSHELRTPLTSIVGYLEMLSEGYGGELNEKQMKMLDVVDRNSRRLLALIEDMLMLSRVESGAFRLSTSLVDVASTVSGAHQLLAPAAAEKQIELAVDVAANLSPVTGDANQLERILLNLGTNALKFTPDGGRVSIDVYESAGQICVSVTDNGIGIPIEEQHRLFSRFFRSSIAQDRAIQGTGLGLAIVKSIVERHGGTIVIQSAPGSGTAVIVELPVAETAVEAAGVHE